MHAFLHGVGGAVTTITEDGVPAKKPLVCRDCAQVSSTHLRMETVSESDVFFRFKRAIRDVVRTVGRAPRSRKGFEFVAAYSISVGGRAPHVRCTPMGMAYAWWG